MQKYKVTLILTADEYMDLAPRLGSHSPKIEKVVDKGFDAGVELDPSAMRGRAVTRRKRRTKAQIEADNALAQAAE